LFPFVNLNGIAVTQNILAMQEKEDWINAIGRSIVRHSRSVTDDEVYDYDSKRAS
jgi:hypothetical protein